MIMLAKLGMRSCIVDAFDKDLQDIARGKRPDVDALVHQVMDRNEPDLGSLDKEAQGYV